MAKIAMIPTDNLGNKLFLKDFRRDKSRLFIKYRSTYNDVPFTETQIYSTDGDGGQNCAICGDDGTVLYIFSINWINKIM